MPEWVEFKIIFKPQMLLACGFLSCRGQVKDAIVAAMSTIRPSECEAIRGQGIPGASHSFGDNIPVMALCGPGSNFKACQ